MAFFLQSLLLLMLLEKERLIKYSTVSMYVLNIPFVLFFAIHFCSHVAFHNRDLSFTGFQDGTWGTIKGSITVVRDFRDFCYHSYFSYMDDLRLKGPPDVKYYEIRFSVSAICLYTCL